MTMQKSVTTTPMMMQPTTVSKISLPLPPTARAAEIATATMPAPATMMGTRDREN